MASVRTAASALRQVPSWIARPSYAWTGQLPTRRTPPAPKTTDQYRRLKEAGQLASAMRRYAGALVQAGVTTDDLDQAVHDEIVRHGAYPSPLNYAGFPKSICTSVNDVLCHGVPGPYALDDGDLVKIDVSVFYNGVHGDCCATFVVGRGSERGRRLADAARAACHAGVAACAPGRSVNGIGAAIAAFAADQRYAVSDVFTGHGIGADLHELPYIMHTELELDDLVLEPGMVFTVEPILVDGPSAAHVVLDDGWTARSPSGYLASQHEEMVGITETGFEILTGSDAAPLPAQ